MVKAAKHECLMYIKHINPLIFEVIDDKTEEFIMYKHELVGRGFI